VADAVIRGSDVLIIKQDSKLVKDMIKEARLSLSIKQKIGCFDDKQPFFNVRLAVHVLKGIFL